MGDCCVRGCIWCYVSVLPFFLSLLTSVQDIPSKSVALIVLTSLPHGDDIYCYFLI